MPLQRAVRSLAKVYAGQHPLDIHVLIAKSADPQPILDALHAALTDANNIHYYIHPVKSFSADPEAEINRPAYMRLAIPELFKEFQTAVYMDVDLFFKKDPTPLLELIPQPADAILAAHDIQNPTLGSGIAMPGWENLGLSAEQNYFNSGVMVINIHRWRELHITEQAIKFVSNHPEHLRFMDQDALNYVLKDHWSELDIKWNYPPLSAILKVPGNAYYAEKYFPLQAILDQEAAAAVVHFVGPNKPWQADFPDLPITRLYKEFTSLK